MTDETPAKTSSAATPPGPRSSASWLDANLDERIRMLEEGVRSLIKDAADTRFRLDEESRASLEGRKRLVLSMLDVLDAFDRVFGNVETKRDEVTPQMKTWLGNFRSVRRLLERAIVEEGVARMENVDDGFNPHWHTVSETVGDPSRAEGEIVQISRPGYFFREQVLRKAEVIVVKNSD